MVLAWLADDPKLCQRLRIASFEQHALEGYMGLRMVGSAHHRFSFFLVRSTLSVHTPQVAFDDVAPSQVSFFFGPDEVLLALAKEAKNSKAATRWRWLTYRR